MSDQDGKKSIKQLSSNPLKALSIDAIELAFSIALSELAKQGYEVDVHSLTLANGIGQSGATMEIAVRKKVYPGDSPFA